MLVVEDDAATAAFLADNLAADGYGVAVASGVRRGAARDRGAAAGHRAARRDARRRQRAAAARRGCARPTAWSRASTATLPVIVVSGRGSEVERVRGFRCGADDYLVKPFSYPELRRADRCGAAAGERPAAARHRARRRPGDRPGRAPRDARRLADRAVGQGVRTAARAGRRADARLHQAASCCATSGATRSPASRRTVDTHASRLRRKLAGGDGRSCINVRGVGYRLVEERRDFARRTASRARCAARVAVLQRRLVLVARAEHELRGPLTTLLMACRARAAAGRGAGARAARAGRPGGGAARARAPRRAASRSISPRWRASVAPGRAVVDWAAGPRSIRADPRRLSQALGNLVANAREHGRGDVVDPRAPRGHARADRGRRRRAGHPRAPSRRPWAGDRRGGGRRRRRAAGRERRASGHRPPGGAVKRRRRRGVLLLSLALASGGLAASEVRSRTAAVEERVGPLVPVVDRARRRSSRGRSCRPSQFTVAQVPARYAPPDALADPAQARGPAQRGRARAGQLPDGERARHERRRRRAAPATAWAAASARSS